MIKETCSCGSKFEATNQDSAKLWREWRKNHRCEFKTVEREIQAVHGESANTEIPMGFQPGELPAKKYDPWEDKRR